MLSFSCQMWILSKLTLRCWSNKALYNLQWYRIQMRRVVIGDRASESLNRNVFLLNICIAGDAFPWCLAACQIWMWFSSSVESMNTLNNSNKHNVDSRWLVAKKWSLKRSSSFCKTEKADLEFFNWGYTYNILKNNNENMLHSHMMCELYRLHNIFIIKKLSPNLWFKVCKPFWKCYLNQCGDVKKLLGSSKKILFIHLFLFGLFEHKSKFIQFFKIYY